MKSCDELGPDLVDLVFGKPAPERLRELNEHLESCERCRAEEQRLLAVREAVGREQPAPGPAVRERVRAALPARTHRGPLAALAWRPVPAYAAAIACLAVALATGVALRSGPARPSAGVRTAIPAPDTIAGPLAPFTPAGSYDTGIAWAVAEATPRDTAGRRGGLQRDSL